jgi:hypothetical protein
MDSRELIKIDPSTYSIVVLCLLDTIVVEIPQSNNRNIKYISRHTEHEVVEVSSVKMRTTITIEMNSSLDDMLFMRLVDNITDEYEFNEIIQIWNIGYEYFGNIELTHKTVSKIQKWINRLGRSSYIWDNLTNKPDYNLELYRKRFYPFYHIKSKEWKEVANNARSSEDYPPTNSKIFEKGHADTEDFKDEKTVSLKHNNFMSYPVLNPSKYGNIVEYVEFLRFLMKLNLKVEALEVFLRLCITPSSCHIVKSAAAWELIKPMIKDMQAKSIVMYTVYYAQYILRHESTKMFSQVRRTYRIIYTLDEARALPDSHTLHIESDPYIQQLPDDTFISQTVPFYLREKRLIADSKTMDRRLFLATGGALVNIDMKSLKATLSGSILIPCITISPLEELRKGLRMDPTRKVSGYIPTHDIKYYDLTDEDHEFLVYLEYYYPSYDSYKDREYVKEVLMEKREKIIEFCMKDYIEKKDSDLDPNDKAEKLPEYNKLADLDISLTTSTFEDFRVKAMLLFDQIRNNVAFRGPVWIIEIETLSSFKFQIYGPGITRPIDLFRIPYDCAKMVKKFHVPCVRMWNEGTQGGHLTGGKIQLSNTTVKGVLLYDSCIRALKSGVNNSYNWFSCNKIPVDVLLKYTQRGITTIYNKKERVGLVEYLKLSPRWSPLIDFDSSGEIDSNTMDIFGVMTVNHKFFHPAKFNAGIRMGLRNTLFQEEDTFYSKRQSINYPEHNTKYGGNLAIKTNNSVNPPKLENITKYISYLKDDAWISSDEDQ